jgi:hypothetical protein
MHRGYLGGTFALLGVEKTENRRLDPVAELVRALALGWKNLAA